MMEFSTSDLWETLESQPDSGLINAPFGIVKMDKSGTISLYNNYEAKLAGLNPDDTVGKNFFTDVAPCTNNFMVAHKFQESESVDDTFEYMFTYKLNPTKVTLRLLRNSGYDHGYVLVKLREG